MQTGDVVRLKSGGPKMTVKAVNDTEATCTWFDRNGRIKSDDFALATLQAYLARPAKQVSEDG